MASHSLTKIDQKEYLKKYLSGDKVKKKKKDKKHKKSSSSAVKVKIIDDDINNLDNGQEIDEELLLTGEDAPQIVGEYIEEMPGDSKVPKWKSIVIKDEPDDDREDVGQKESDLWGRKPGVVKIKQEKRSNRSPDNSPPRRKERKRKSSSSSPPRRQRNSSSPHRKSKSDKSPSRRRKHEESPERRHKIKTEPQSPPYRKREHSPAKRQNSRADSWDRSSICLRPLPQRSYRCFFFSSCSSLRLRSSGSSSAASRARRPLRPVERTCTSALRPDTSEDIFWKSTSSCLRLSRVSFCRDWASCKPAFLPSKVFPGFGLWVGGGERLFSDSCFSHRERRGGAAGGGDKLCESFSRFMRVVGEFLRDRVGD